MNDYDVIIIDGARCECWPHSGANTGIDLPQRSRIRVAAFRRNHHVIYA